jgi:hypothetical protein
MNLSSGMSSFIELSSSNHTQICDIKLCAGQNVYGITDVNRFEDTRLRTCNLKILKRT